MDQAMLGKIQQHLASGGQLSEMLPDLDPANPAVGLVSQMLAQRQQRLEAELEQSRLEPPPATQEDFQQQLELEAQRQAEALRNQEHHRQRMEKLRHRFEEMDAELRWSRRKLDDLAQALGACPTCWGEDPRCRLCRGRGKSGFLMPEPEYFERYVTPILQLPHVVPPPNPATTGLTATGPTTPERSMP